MNTGGKGTILEKEDGMYSLDALTESNNTPQLGIPIINNKEQQETETEYYVTEILEQGSCFTAGFVFLSEQTG